MLQSLDRIKHKLVDWKNSKKEMEIIIEESRNGDYISALELCY